MGGYNKSNSLFNKTKPQEWQHILVFSKNQEKRNTLNRLADCDLGFVRHRGKVEQLAITKLLENALCSPVSSDYMKRVGSPGKRSPSDLNMAIPSPAPSSKRPCCSRASN